MRRTLLGVCLGLWGASLAAAQSTTTTVAATSSTSIPTSTSTLASTTTSSTVCTSAACAFKNYDPRQCANTSASKEECRGDCCTTDFDQLVAFCDGDACGGDWDQFVEDWKTAGDFYKFCQNTDDNDAGFDEADIGKKFQEFNVDDSCQPYRFGCKKAARKHVRQCADAVRCVGCCRTLLRRWRADLVEQVMKGGGRASCKLAVGCLRKATRKAEACRDVCRRRPTCGESQFRNCLAATPGGRDVLECYAKCADKCTNADSYRWCVQACQGLGECAKFDECAGVTPTTTTLSSTSTSSSSSLPGATSTSTSTSSSSSSLPAPGALETRASSGRCLPREEFASCEPITTTTTSTSSTTSSTSKTTTSTSSSTTTTSPLLVGARFR